MTLAHPHIYQPHFGMVKACVEGFDRGDWREIKDAGFTDMHDGDKTEWASGVEPQLPAWSVEDIEADPDGYVQHVRRLASRVNRSTWSPKPLLIV